METFDEWLRRNAKAIAEPGQLEHNSVGWMRKAFDSAKGQSRNYVADAEINPTRITFGNGRTVTAVNGHLEVGNIEEPPNAKE